MKIRFLFIALSLFLHALALWYVMVGLDLRVRKKEIVQAVELLPSEAPQISESKVKSDRPARTNSLKAFKPKYFDPKLYFDGDSSAEGSSESASRVSNDDSAEANWGSGAGEFARIEDYSLMDGIYRKIDSILFYPGVLALHKIKGTVNARLVLNADGRCNWNETEISANDSHLKVYILDVLKKACRQDFARYIKDRNRTNVEFRESGPAPGTEPLPSTAG